MFKKRRTNFDGLISKMVKMKSSKKNLIKLQYHEIIH